MNLNHLEAFCNVVKEGSISKAAKNLHLTQPALSSQINSLEEYFGIALFNRNNKGVELTEAGESLFYYAKRILQLKSGLITAIDQIKHKSSKPIVIGAASTVGGYALPCSIYIFKEKHEEAEVQVMVMNSSKIIQALLDREIDLGFIEGYDRVKDCYYSHIYDDELVLVTTPENPWGLIDNIKLEDIKKIPFIIREFGSGSRYTIESNLNKYGMTIDSLNVVMELNSLSAIKASVEAMRGVALLPRMAIKKELRTKSLIQIRIEDLSFKHPYGLIKRHGQNKTGYLEKSFIQFILSPNERGFC